MSVLIQPLVDRTGFAHGAILATDKKVRFVWSPDVEPWFPDTRERISALVGTEKAPETAAEWLSLASTGIGTEYFAYTGTEQFPGEAEARVKLASYFENNGSVAEGRVSYGAQQAMDDFVEAEGDIDDPAQVVSLVLSMLGPIEPDGPNGWLLKAAAGEPYDVENAVIHWPGQETS